MTKNLTAVGYLNTWGPWANATTPGGSANTREGPPIRFRPAAPTYGRQRAVVKKCGTWPLAPLIGPALSFFANGTALTFNALQHSHVEILRNLLKIGKKDLQKIPGPTYDRKVAPSSNLDPN